jgi:hypothetical protein
MDILIPRFHVECREHAASAAWVLAVVDGDDVGAQALAPEFAEG